MDLKTIFSWENIQVVGSICGSIALTAYVAYKTFKSKLEKLDLGKVGTSVAKEVKRQSTVDVEITQEMDKVKELLGADRVQVYEFHNGAHYANGRSALKTTCTYEVCRYGVHSCVNVLSGIPLSCIPNFINRLLDDGELYVENLKDIEERMPATYSLKHSMDITSFYDVVINNKMGEPVGFVAIQYCDGVHHEVNKDEIKRLAWFIESKLL